MTKIYCDSADYKIIKKYNKYNLVKGFTTNPSLMRLAGAKNYKDYSKKILKICKNKPISFEVFSDDLNSMINQAYLINSWGKNVYVKIPVVNSRGKFTGKVIKELSNQGVKLNITAVYTFEQVKKIYKLLNKNTKSIISIFAGRMSDTGKDPIPVFKSSLNLTKKNKNIMILWASTREAYNFIQAKKLGSNIITMPPKIIDQIKNFGKSYKSLTINTVKNFLIDSKKSRFKI
jgi:transaldolase|tara:strand:+ start:42 stop:737 length:696 start_codon:yes stop_codon:yes gene_type:complete